MINILNVLYFLIFIHVSFAVDPSIITAFDQLDPASFESNDNASDVKSPTEYLERLGIINHLKNLWDIDPDVAEDSLLTTVSIL